MHDWQAIEKQVVENLWRRGFTVVRRPEPNTLFDAVEPLGGRHYEWRTLDSPDEGWSPVMTDAHPGVFAPYHVAEAIRHGNLRLMWCDKAKADAHYAEARAKAKKNVDDWVEKHGAEFTGFVRTGTEVRTVGADNVMRCEICDWPLAESREKGCVAGDCAYRPGLSAGAMRTKIPRDELLFDHLAELLRERDRLVSAAIKGMQETLSANAKVSMTSLRDSCLHLAIETIRKKYGKDQSNGANPHNLRAVATAPDENEHSGSGERVGGGGEASESQEGQG
jgi:hypothetical protein